MPSSFEYRGLRCLAPAAEGEPWSYLPLRADVQRDAQGRPLLTLIESGSSGYLMFCATWSAAREDLEAARDEVASRAPGATRGRVGLSFAPIVEPSCNALIGNGGGGFRPVATSGTSGFPPYDAVFNLFLQDEPLARARRGLQGEAGHLAVEYVANLPLPARGRATLRADARTISSWLRDHAGGGGLVRALEAAVASGKASIVVEAPDPFAGALAAQLHDRVLARAAELLPSLMREDASGDFQVSATLEQRVSVPIRAFADVGALVRAEPQGSLIGGHHAAD